MTPRHLPGIVLADKPKNSESFSKAVAEGRTGLMQGMSNGLIRINNYLYGTHRGRYYLVGADSGVGKTTLADFMFLVSLWLDCKAKGIPMRGIYLSFELSKESKIARWVCTFIKYLYDVDLPSDYIMGRIPGLVLSDEHLKMVNVAQQYVDAMLDDIKVVEAGVHPTWIFNEVIGMYEEIGTVHRAAPPKDKPKAKGFITGYTPHDPKMITVLMCDHLALAHEEKGLSGIKAVIDRISQNAVFLKNTFKTIIVFLQQFTTDLVSTHRSSKKGDSIYTPQRLDFGDSKYTYRDADVVFGLVSPVMFDVETYRKYDIKMLMEYFLACHIMKNRYGPASRMIPLFMNRISGVFEELPQDPLNLFSMEPFYNKVNKLESLCQLFSPQTTTQPQLSV